MPLGPEEDLPFAFFGPLRRCAGDHIYYTRVSFVISWTGGSAVKGARTGRQCSRSGQQRGYVLYLSLALSKGFLYIFLAPIILIELYA